MIHLSKSMHWEGESCEDQCFLQAFGKKVKLKDETCTLARPVSLHSLNIRNEKLVWAY